jgi:hypothetical protein
MACSGRKGGPLRKEQGWKGEEAYMGIAAEDLVLLLNPASLNMKVLWTFIFRLALLNRVSFFCFTRRTPRGQGCCFARDDRA